MGLFTRRSSLGGGLFGRRHAADHDPLVGGGYRRSYGMLTPPSLPLFIIAIVVAGAALLVRYARIDVPIVTASNAFDILALGFAILVIGVLLPRA